MKITQLRNATVVLEFHSQGQDIVLLVDSMLAEAGALPALRYFGGQRRRNPLVPLPPGSEALLGRVSHGLITHCQRGHFDHLDRAGKRWLREAAVPVLAMPRDADYLRQRGLQVQALQGPVRQPLLPAQLSGAFITPIPCVHGRGIAGLLMEHGHGYLIEVAGEPSVYLAGDTVMCEPLRHCLSILRPDVAVLPAGGARFDLGAEILLTPEELIEAAALCPQTQIVANHLEALDHCPGTRARVRELAMARGLQARVWVPEDGDTLSFPARTSANDERLSPSGTCRKSPESAPIPSAA